jgi:hypothetical protein
LTQSRYSAALNLLNRHFGWSMSFVSTPKQTKGPLPKRAR